MKTEAIIKDVVPNSIALDPINEKIYWTEGGSITIQRANLDGSDKEIVVRTKRAPDIAIDPRRGKVYWGDASMGSIYRADLDGTNREDLKISKTPRGGSFRQNRKFPTVIALDVDDDMMYWADRKKQEICKFDLLMGGSK